MILLFLGIFTLVCTFYKPSFYWESRKAKSMRKLIGDSGTTALYYLIGLSVSVIGIFGALGIISLK
ncbi:conserved hypothetical protein [Ilyobacter polytropus DSM 2926]|uniref:Uncharacterized protein n=1 Tax=Ilyobacter polytropus (strain ATCC 51220 / DSM 2926 / LMG 16218 / CuHBu1) TaxID=572544 RepID=E3H802_ILYPC|nr:conserved hypothetical protein [Ilyobacter polytropus DSM 2926]